jgi:hypothetical protein
MPGVPRRRQNEALKDIKDLPHLVEALTIHAPQVIVRGQYGSGSFTQPRTKGDREDHTPAPPYSDPTGEEAISEERSDRVSQSVEAIVGHLQSAVALSKQVLAITPADTAERALRNVPSCLACGDPCYGRVRSGYDDKCYTRWLRAGRPDRGEFAMTVRKQQASANVP